MIMVGSYPLQDNNMRVWCYPSCKTATGGYGVIPPTRQQHEGMVLSPARQQLEGRELSPARQQHEGMVLSPLQDSNTRVWIYPPYKTTT